MKRASSGLALVIAAALCCAACGDDASTAGGGPAGGAGGGAPLGGGGQGGDGGAGGAPPPLVVEAGFVEVPAADPGAAAPARMFYSFHPAQSSSNDAPLLVLFNGGPGWATSDALMVFGTGAQSLDAGPGASGELQANAGDWTRFANVLYVDDRMAGFSYGLGDPACDDLLDSPALHLGNTADFILVLLEFMDGHPALIDNPVALVGESYGGGRATLMVYTLQNYAKWPDMEQFPDPSYYPDWLAPRIQAHFDAAFPALAGSSLAPADVAQQFGYAVLVQPSIAGSQQDAFQQPYIQANPDFAEYNAMTIAYDAFDVRLTVEESAEIDALATATVRAPDALELLLGVPLAGIDGLAAADREGAFRNFDVGNPREAASLETELRAALGDLGANDAYFVPAAQTCGVTFESDLATATALLEIAPRTHLFITNARWDARIMSAALPDFFSQAVPTTWHKDTPAGAERPGELEMTLSTGPVVVRFPPYEAGHVVTRSAGPELGEDIEAWMRAAGAI